MYTEKTSYSRDSVISNSFSNYKDKNYHNDSLRIKKLLKTFQYG